ncbi:MAG: glutathione synthetase [Thiovulaceae bacterium]|nr:glutathione synthetase [Sulfurimonadaceae bacterium]
MRIGFVLNNLLHEALPSTTLLMAMTATNMGHEVWLMGVGDFSYNSDEFVHARARSVPAANYETPELYYRILCSEEAKSERITVDDLDVLMLRNNPAADYQCSWAQHASVVFGRTAMRHGVIVCNDPNGLSKAVNKMYFQYFPESVRLQSLISRNHDDIRHFYHQHAKRIIIKPLMGSGGRNVFMVQPEDAANLNQMIDAISRDGYVIAEEFMPQALEGDVRMLLINGRPLKVDGKYAAFRRARSGEDIRSNLHAGGTPKPVKVTDEMLELAEIIRPKLVQDGIFFAGIDIVGNKLLEVNVFSPGGLTNSEMFEKVNFTAAVIEALEKKVHYVKYYHRNFDNVEMNTL